MRLKAKRARGISADRPRVTRCILRRSSANRLCGRRCGGTTRLIRRRRRKTRGTLGLGLILGMQREVEMRVGLSFVSVKNAQMNAKLEVFDRDFNAIARQRKQNWSWLLNRVDLQGGTPSSARFSIPASITRCYRRMILATLGDRTLASTKKRTSTTRAEGLVQVFVQSSSTPTSPTGIFTATSFSCTLCSIQSRVPMKRNPSSMTRSNPDGCRAGPLPTT